MPGTYRLGWLSPLSVKDQLLTDLVDRRPASLASEDRASSVRPWLGESGVGGGVSSTWGGGGGGGDRGRG